MRLVAAVLAGLLLVACAEDQAASEDPGSGEPRDTVLEGTLGGDAQLEGGCAWLDAADGRYEVAYPEGYEIAFEPLRLLGPDGDTVAAEGDTVRVDGQVGEDMMSLCQVGTIFQATDVLGGS